MDHILVQTCPKFDLKIKISKTEKTPPGIHPSYTCAKFQTGLTIYVFPRVPQRLLVYLGPRTGSPRPKIQNFQKLIKTPPWIHPSYTCTKCQTDLTIHAFPRALKGFQSILGPGPRSLGPKIKIFKKMKNTPSGI